MRRHPAGSAGRPTSGIFVAAVRRSKLPLAAGRCGLLAVFRVRRESHSGLSPSEELVPVFSEGPCPRLLRRQDVRARALSAMAALVPRMAASIPSRPAEPARAGGGSARDGLLAARAQTRCVAQRGLFDRRAEREADRDDDAPAAAHTLGSAAAQPPQPVLLLFVTL
jgi:hypothetical protein